MLKLLTIALTITLTLTSTCKISDERCQSCLPETPSKCSSCYDSFWSSKNACEVPKTKIQNCRSYKNSTQCQQCHIGYILKNNSCQKLLIENCLFSENVENCESCDDSYLPAADNSLCTKTSCAIKYCNICAKIKGAFETCLICDSGFSAGESGLECGGYKGGSINCLKVDEQGCVRCKDGFFMDKDKCVESDFIPKFKENFSVVLGVFYGIILLFF